jgi:hypothetical protein
VTFRGVLRGRSAAGRKFRLISPPWFTPYPSAVVFEYPASDHEEFPVRYPAGVFKLRSHKRSSSEAVHPAPAPTIIAPTPEPPSEFLLWLLAAVLTFWSFGFTTMTGSDLWWHLASGRWICEKGSLNFKDPWSFTSFGQPWTSREWLSDVIFHAWSSWFGMATLVWWKWSVLVSAFVLVFMALRRISGSSLAAYLAALLAIATGAPFFDVRPQLYSVLGFAALLHVALLPSRFRWPVALGFFFWVNLHSGFSFGLLALTAILVVAWLLGESPRNALPLWLACLLACLANPQGPSAFVLPLRYAINSYSPYLHVGEWTPPWEAGGIHSVLYFPAICVFVLSIVGAFLLRLHSRQPRLTLTGIILGLLTLVMSLKSRRFIPLFGIAQSVLLAPVLTISMSRLAGRFHVVRWTMFRQYLLPVLATGLGAWWLLSYPLSSRAFLYLTSQDTFPVEAINVADANQLSGKVFSYYEWGGYLDLRTNGRLKVYIDGRADTVFDDKIYRRYTHVLGLEQGWEELVDASGADYFLWPRRQKKHIEALRDSGKWRMLYSDRTAALLIRSNVSHPEPLLPSPDSPWREVALGWRASSAKKLPEAEQHFLRALEMMPNLRLACEWLANIYARSDRMADAEATLNHCQKLFPDPKRRDELLTYFRTRADTDL